MLFKTIKKTAMRAELRKQVKIITAVLSDSEMQDVMLELALAFQAVLVKVEKAAKKARTISENVKDEEKPSEN